jgi:hypothetical protein
MQIFLVVFIGNTDYFLQEHKPTGLCNGHRLCPLSDRNVFLIYDLDNVYLQKVKVPAKLTLCGIIICRSKDWSDKKNGCLIGMIFGA